MSSANTGEKTYRILVFGSHSAGKTSVINMLTGEKNPVSNSIEGTTFSFKDSIYVSNKEGDKNSVYKFRDTIGLNNDFKLEISSIEHLKKLIIESHEGYNLLIHVKRMGAIVNTDTQNYELIVENLFDRAQNAICVITEAENLDSPETWWRENKPIFERNRMIYCDGIAVCSASSTMPALELVYAQFRKKYKKELWNLIKRHLSDESFFPKVQTSRIMGFFQKCKLLTDTISFAFSSIFSDEDYMQKNEVKRIKENPDKNEKMEKFVHIDNTSGKTKDLYLHALLCKASKGYFKEYEAILNSNRWIRYIESNTYLIDNEHLNGYSGVAFMLKDNDGFVDEVAFAHRGTQFDIFGNVLADIKIACLEHPSIVDNAVEFQIKVMDSLAQMGKLKQTTRILHTGFSLGGYIAAACALKPIDPNYSTRGVTFDAPGLVSYHQVNNIINYVTIPNLVNTCNRHVGEIIELYSDEFRQYDLIQKVEIKNLTGVFDEVNATLASHNLEKIIDIISRKNYCASEILRWPVAQRNLDVNVLNQLIERLKKSDGVLDTFAAIDDCISNINYFRINHIDYKEFD